MEDRKTSCSLSFEARCSLPADGRAGKSTLKIRGLGSSPMVKEPAIRFHPVSKLVWPWLMGWEKSRGRYT